VSTIGHFIGGKEVCEGGRRGPVYDTSTGEVIREQIKKEKKIE
jgi:hypothetical protein